MFVSQYTSLMWQNAANDDLRRRPTGRKQTRNFHACLFLADRTNGRTYATVLCLPVVCDY